jgi:3-dehydroquinate dehydratase
VNLAIKLKTKIMDTKFNMSKETQRQLLEVYELRIDRLQKRIEHLDQVIKELS